MEELSLHILDIVENSVSAGATLVEIRIEYRFGEKPWLTITVRDNGRAGSERDGPQTLEASEAIAEVESDVRSLLLQIQAKEFATMVYE